jgi:type II secretory pathway pseudopilin PulG
MRFAVKLKLDSSGATSARTFHSFFWGAHAPRVLIAAPRRNLAPWVGNALFVSPPPDPSARHRWGHAGARVLPNVCKICGLERAFRQRGTVLLEVLAALMLFVAAAAIITSGMNASLNSVERLRLNTHALNLAVSVISELQMGMKSLELGGVQPFEAPFEGWTWEVLANPDLEGPAGQASPLRKVEVVIRHGDPALTYRLGQMLRVHQAIPSTEAKSSAELSPLN